MRFALGLVLASAASAANTGPWDLPALRQTPAVTWVKQDGTLRSLYYASEPYQGRATRVFAYYAVPEGVPGKVPAMVLVHGGGGKAFSEWATLWAARGYAALAMDLSGRGPDGKRLEDGGPEQDDKAKFHSMPLGLKETWPYHAVAAVIRGISVLAAQPEVDATRIGITGISWGGYLTSLVSGLDDRLKVSIPVYGCGFLYENSVWLKTLTDLPQRDEWIANFDPSRYLPNARMPMLWVNGTNDFAYPLDSYQKSYRLVQGPRTLCVTVRMKHSHPDGWKPAEIGLFADQVLKGQARLAVIEGARIKGTTVAARFRSKTPVQTAGLHYTTDSGAWKDRNWQTVPATLKGRRVEATLPAQRPLLFFLTITDSRGATVSTEHQAAP